MSTAAASLARAARNAVHSLLTAEGDLRIAASSLLPVAYMEPGNDRAGRVLEEADALAKLRVAVCSMHGLEFVALS